MPRKKAVKTSDSASGASDAATSTGAASGYNGQVHTVTFQPGGSATCNPLEVGPGYASEPFSVARFRAECQDVLKQLSAHIGSAGDLSAADLDVADLRLTSLDEELVAARAEAPDTAAGVETADTAADGNAAGTATAAVAETGDTATAAAAAEAAAVTTAAAAHDAAGTAATATAREDANGGSAPESPEAPKRGGRSRGGAKRSQMPAIPTSPPRRSGRNRQLSLEAVRAAANADAAQPAAADGSQPQADTSHAAPQPSVSGADGADGGNQQPEQPEQDAENRQQQPARVSKRGLGVRDMGVKFHPSVELELIERVKRRRAEHRTAAEQALTCLQASGTASSSRGTPGAKSRRNTNYAPPSGSEAATDTVGGPAADRSAAGADAAAAEIASDAAAGTAGTPAPDGTSGAAVDASEVVLTVALSHPANAQLVLQRWRVLGSQRLSALRDRLYCRSDLDMRAAGLAVPSGMFYIEGSFYNDMRDTAAVDYSYPIRAFCHTHSLAPPPRPARASAEDAASGGQGRSAVPVGSSADAAAADGDAPAEDATATAPATAEDRGPGAYECADMAHTTFEQMWLRLGSGAGYVYCHQGCCEHQLAFSDIRMLHPDDPQQAAAYPELVYQKHSRKRRCELCDRAPAVKVTYEDAFAPGSPAFWCLDCFNRMHYDEQRCLVSSDFKVFDYVHD